MTYGRARLWLGVSGVGSLVVIATALLAMDLPKNLLTTSPTFGLEQLLQLALVVGTFALWSTPFDFLGGYMLPKKYGKPAPSFRAWLSGYVAATLAQAACFVLVGCLIVVLSQQFGVIGSVVAVGLGILGCTIVRNYAVLSRKSKSPESSQKLLEAITAIQSWQTFVPRTVVVDHQDVGFTGGIIGFGERAQIVIPSAWLSFPREQLATVIARRAVAINSGSYSRGLLVACAWNIVGFVLCAFLVGVELNSVAGLTTNVCAFTLWSFVGLLVLPSLSRTASLAVNAELAKQGMPADFISTTAKAIDQLQDEESTQTDVSIGNPTKPLRGLAAWNVTRTTLFFSWACLGVLSRSVHCNVGRPELWTMLPTD